MVFVMVMIFVLMSVVLMYAMVLVRRITSQEENSQ
jgi:hypothetical protein